MWVLDPLDVLSQAPWITAQKRIPDQEVQWKPALEQMGSGGGTEEEYGLAGHDLPSETQGRRPGGRCTLCPILTWNGQGYIH